MVFDLFLFRGWGSIRVNVGPSSRKEGLFLLGKAGQQPSDFTRISLFFASTKTRRISSLFSTRRARIPREFGRVAATMCSSGCKTPSSKTGGGGVHGAMRSCIKLVAKVEWAARKRQQVKQRRKMFMPAHSRMGGMAGQSFSPEIRRPFGYGTVVVNKLGIGGLFSCPGCCFLVT